MRMMTKPPVQCRTLNLLTAGQMVRLFKVTELTLRRWRKDHGLPHVIIPGDGKDNIRYDLEEVKRWARDTGHRLYLVMRKKAG